MGLAAADKIGQLRSVRRLLVSEWVVLTLLDCRCGGAAVFFTFCGYDLERFIASQDAWEITRHFPLPGQGCNAALYKLGNGKTTIYKLKLPPDVVPGLYRFSLPSPSAEDPELSPNSPNIESLPFEVRYPSSST